jgi:hypothetical protein
MDRVNPSRKPNKICRQRLSFCLRIVRLRSVADCRLPQHDDEQL